MLFNEFVYGVKTSINLDFDRNDIDRQLIEMVNYIKKAISLLVKKIMKIK